MSGNVTKKFRGLLRPLQVVFIILLLPMCGDFFYSSFIVEWKKKDAFEHLGEVLLEIDPMYSNISYDDFMNISRLDLSGSEFDDSAAWNLYLCGWSGNYLNVDGSKLTEKGLDPLSSIQDLREIKIGNLQASEWILGRFKEDGIHVLR